MNGVFEGSGLELILKVDRNHGVLIVIVRNESWHLHDSLSGGVHFNKYQRVLGVFLQPQRPSCAAQTKRSVVCVRTSALLCSHIKHRLCAWNLIYNSSDNLMFHCLLNCSSKILNAFHYIGTMKHSSPMNVLICWRLPI